MLKHLLQRLRISPSPFAAGFGEVAIENAHTGGEVQQEGAAVRRAGREERLKQHEASIRELTRTLTITAVAARLAACDGPVNEQEKAALLSIFPEADHPRIHIQEYFVQAAADTAPMTHYTRSLKASYGEEPRVMEELFQSLLAFAGADGPVNVHEAMFLKILAEAFLLPEGFFSSHYNRALLGVHMAPHRILGIARNASGQQAKQAFHGLARLFHEDYVGAHTQDATILHATRQFYASAQQAYHHFRDEK